MKLIKPKANNEGFTILFAVLAAGALLIMALGIANIAYREVVLSGSARVAGHAFFAADSGAECALYLEKQGVFPDSLSTGTIDCLNLPPFIPSTAGPNHEFQLNDAGSNRCIKIKVSNNYTAGSDTYTRIESRGYNVECTNISGNPRAVERSIEVLLD